MTKTIKLSLLLVAVTVITYWNHFDNGFHFDDFTVIVNNLYIQELRNIPSFFTDINTYSTFPPNRIYRPIVTTSLAIDYWLGNGLDPIYFHLSMFTVFLIQGLLMFFIFQKIINKTREGRNSLKLFTLGIVAWYLLHPVNAETLNYILARSDLYSTFFVVAALYMFAKGGNFRTYFIYLIPLVLGLLTKRTSTMFLPILFFYVLLFESEYSIHQCLSFVKDGKYRTLHLHLLVVLLVCSGAYILADAMTIVPYKPTIQSDYIITQPFVLLHYFKMLFVPLELSADSDWQSFNSLWHSKVILGFCFLFIIIAISLYCGTRKKLKPISFGILWFLFALVPTSSFIALPEVMNDHRMYFPYVGLVLAVGWTIYLIVAYVSHRGFLSDTVKKTLLFLYILLMVGYAYGTHLRNQVWDNPENLWQDVTIKSPKNGRGLMNYGVALMEKGEVGEALSYFKKAQKYIPDYSYLYINKAIALAYEGEYDKAETNFFIATKLEPPTPASHYYYARFLKERQRMKESIEQLDISLKLAPGDIDSRHLLMEILSEVGEFERLDSLVQKTLAVAPGDKVSLSYLERLDEAKDIKNESGYGQYNINQILAQSLKAYNQGMYEACISFCRQILEIDSSSTEALNNICSAYTQLGQLEKAEEACLKALQINPDYELATNNLNYLRSLKK